MTKDTRYDEGDLVKAKNPADTGLPDEAGEIVDIEKPGSSSPTYVVQYAGHPVDTTVDAKASELEKAEPKVGNLDLPTMAGEYELEDVGEDMASYVGESGEYLVYIDIVKKEFANRRPIYSIRGEIRSRGGEFETDFTPSTKTQYSTAETAVSNAEDIMSSYDPEDAVKDNEMRL
jgi:hypothetical protein